MFAYGFATERSTLPLEARSLEKLVDPRKRGPHADCLVSICIIPRTKGSGFKQSIKQSKKETALCVVILLGATLILLGGSDLDASQEDEEEAIIVSVTDLLSAKREEKDSQLAGIHSLATRSLPGTYTYQYFSMTIRIRSRSGSNPCSSSTVQRSSPTQRGRKQSGKDETETAHHAYFQLSKSRIEWLVGEESIKQGL